MRIGLIDSSRRREDYPIALLKLGAMLKAHGHICQIYTNEIPERDAADEVWITTLFTFELQHALALVQESIRRGFPTTVGGVAASLFPDHFRAVGAEVHCGLLPEAETVVPDYSLLAAPPEYSIVYLTRGCSNRCKFCVVPRLEPVFHEVLGWERGLHPGITEVLFYDNNWLAQPMELWERDVARLHELVAAGRITKMDFNQGLDARLLTARHAERMEGLPIRPIRFAFDGMHEDGFFQNAVRLVAARGFHTIRSFILYNFHDAIEDFYYRANEMMKLQEELGIWVEGFPMKYRPILEAEQGRGFVGKHWTRQSLSVLSHLLQASSAGKCTLSPRSREEFEFWYGRSAEDFRALLGYPRAKELIMRKAGLKRELHSKFGKDKVTFRRKLVEALE
jgi:hypothetical protein